MRNTNVSNLLGTHPIGRTEDRIEPVRNWNQGMSRNSGSGLREGSRLNPNYGGNNNSTGGEETGVVHHVFIGASFKVARQGET